MRRLSPALLSALFLLFSFRLCLAENALGQFTHKPITPVGLLESSPSGELQIPITTAEKAQARWRRDVVAPKLWQRQDHTGKPTPLAEKMDQYLAGDQAGKGRASSPAAKRELAQIERVLAQVQGTHQQAPQGPHPRSELLQLTLEQSIEIALEHNLRIQIAALVKDSAQAEIPKAEAKFDPTVGFALTGGGERAVTEKDPVSKTNAQDVTAFIRKEVPTGASVIVSSDLTRDEQHPSSAPREFGSGMAITLVQPLLRGGRVYVATKPIRDAEFDLHIQEAQLRAAVLNIIAGAKSAYYTTILAEKIIEVTEEAIRRDQTLIDASQALLQAGLVTKRDVYSAEISRAKDLSKLVSAQADLELAKNALLDLLGLPIATQVSLLDKNLSFQPVPVELEKWVTSAIRNRPEVLAIGESLEKSVLNIRVARNALLPQVDFVASYRRAQSGFTLGRALDFGGYGWSAGLVFSVPIGNVAAKFTVAQAEIEQARLKRELAQQERQVELEVRAAVVKLNRSLERMQALKTIVDQAEGKLEVARAQFALGLATNKDITDAQEDLLDAETDLLKATADYNIGIAELEARIAGPL